MADDNAYANGRTPSPRRDEPASDYRAPAERDNRDRDRDSRPSRQDGPSVNPGNNLHVRGLALRTSEKDLEEIFGQFGGIEKCQVMRDPRTRESRGFAFVTFNDVAAAEEAMNALNATTLDDKVITVEKAKRGRARTPTPGQYQGAEGRPRYGGPGGYGGGGYGGGRDRDYPPRRYDDRDDRRGGGGYDRSYAAPMRGDPRDRDSRPPRRDDYDRPPRDDRRRDDYDRAPPRRDEPRRDRRDYDEPPRRY